MSIETIFAKLDKAIRKEKYEAADLFALIGSFIQEAPGIAYAMSQHASEILAPGHPIPYGTYTDVAVEVYRRTFFDPEEAAKYGTDQMVNDPVALDHFVNFLISPENAAAPHQINAPCHATH